MSNPNIATDSSKTFKPGQSGNLKGRPKGSLSLVTQLRKALQEVHKGTGKQYHALLTEAILKDAIKADGQSRRLAMQYLEGMPSQSIDHTSKGERISVNFDPSFDETSRGTEEGSKEQSTV